MRAKISELSSVTGLPAQICWPRPELRDRLRFTAVSSIFILQAFAWAEIVGSVCIPTQSTKSILGGPGREASERQQPQIQRSRSSSHPSGRPFSSEHHIIHVDALCLGSATSCPLSARTSSRTASGVSRMVFTGIVEEMGTVVSMAREDDLLLWCAPCRGLGCVHSCPWL